MHINHNPSYETNNECCKLEVICQIKICGRHVTNLNHQLIMVSTKSSYMQKLSNIPNMFRSDEHYLSWLVS
jgi:hypothetical protein